MKGNLGIITRQSWHSKIFEKMTDRSLPECYFYNQVKVVELDEKDIEMICYRPNESLFDLNKNGTEDSLGYGIYESISNEEALSKEERPFMDSSLKYSCSSQTPTSSSYICLNDMPNNNNSTEVESPIYEASLSSRFKSQNIVDNEPFAKNGNFHKDQLNSTNENVNSSDRLDGNEQNKVKPYLMKTCEAEIDSQVFNDSEEFSVIFQSKSKSLQNINACVEENEIKKRGSQIPHLKINKNSTRDLCITPKVNSLRRAKSISLNNLYGYGKPDYRHVKSKVKLHIENMKKKNLQKESTSLPTTPLKAKTEIPTILTLDEMMLETFCSTFNKGDKALPDNLQLLKAELQNGTELSKKFLETLLKQLKMERKCRFEQDILLNSLQLKYDNLLAKYAHAENTIDKLRIYRGTDGQGSCYKHSKCPNNNNMSNRRHSEVQIDCDKPGRELKKSLSSSNLYLSPKKSNCCFCSEMRDLVKYSSSPIVDPNISIALQVNKNGTNSNISSVNCSRKVNKLNPLLSNCDFVSLLHQSSFDEEDTHSLDQWVQNFEDLREKLKNFAMLEGNGAFHSSDSERNSIWNYLLELYKDLVVKSDDLAEREKVERVEEAIKYLSKKYNLPLIDSMKRNCIESIKMAKDTSKESLEGAISHSWDNSYVNDQILERKLGLCSHSEDDDFIPERKEKIAEGKLILETGPSSGCFAVKDIDSGCPQSDRSTKNSQCPSVAQLYLSEDLGSLSESQNYSSNGNENNSFIGDACFEEIPESQSGYEADDDDANVPVLLKSCTRRGHHRTTPCSEVEECSLKRNKKLWKKYEDRYVAVKDLDPPDGSSRSYRPPISHFENNTQILKARIEGRRTKYWSKPSNSNRCSLIKTPLKSLDQSTDFSSLEQIPEFEIRVRDPNQKSCTLSTMDRFVSLTGHDYVKPTGSHHAKSLQDKNRNSNSFPGLSHKDRSLSENFENYMSKSQMDIQVLDEAVALATHLKCASESILAKTVLKLGGCAT